MARISSTRPRIDNIEIVTAGRVSSDYIKSYLHTQVGDIYDPEKLKEATQEIATSGYFDSVTHQLIEVGGTTTLHVEANEASWGPNIFRFGLSLNSDFNGNGAFRVAVGHRLPWINSSGLEWRNDLILGSDITSLRTELRQPIPNTDNWYIAPYGEYRQQNQNIYINDLFLNQPPNLLPFAQYQLQTTRGGIDLGIPIGRIGELRAGFEYANFVNEPKSYIPADFLGQPGTGNFFPVGRARLVGPRVRLVLDQLDHVLYPRSGYYFFAENETSLRGGDNGYSESHVKALFATSVGSHTFNFGVEAGGDFGMGATAQPAGFYLGGFQRLSAYPPDQFAGNYVLFARAAYLHPLKSFDTPPFKDLFLGLSAEAGNVWIKENQFGHGPYRQSYSAFLGVTSIVGPLYLGVAFAPSVVNVYFQLGRPF